jgi:hypothetical protein
MEFDPDVADILRMEADFQGVLGGRWVPRKKLEEAAVVIGDRAWLPFLRARHALQSQEAPLDSSCSQLFRTAQRMARARSH